MISSVFTFLVVGVMAVLSAHEILRYRAWRRGGGGIGVSRGGLIRRLVAAGLVVATVLVINYWPERQRASIQAALLAGVLASLAAIFAIALRELHSTSVRVVEEHERLYAQAERDLAAAQGSRASGGGKRAKRKR